MFIEITGLLPSHLDEISKNTKRSAPSLRRISEFVFSKKN